MKHVDAAVIGGGVLGCFAARNLRRWQISTVLLEAAEDVCTGITRANTAIVYAGYDNQPGSLKARMTVRGNGDFQRLCDELEVSFSRCGSLMVAYGPRADGVLQKKYSQGQQNGVPALRILSGDEAMEMEPMLARGITSALYAPTTGTVMPWQLGIAAYENAVHNGCVPYLNTSVEHICRTQDGYVIETNGEQIHCRVVINCAGLQADKIQEMVFAPSVRIFPDGADYLILDRHAPAPRHIIFQEPEEKGKGFTAVPTTEGNLMLGPTQRPLGQMPYATTLTGMEQLKTEARRVLPGADLSLVIRSFAAVRPNPYYVKLQDGQYVPTGKSIGSFVIERPAPGFFSLIGIKTPGLTCAQELGAYLSSQAATYLDAQENPAFDPCRKAITAHGGDGQIICQCEKITRGQILEAIRRGAATVDGVKHRVGSGMGRCQGSRCTYRIEKLLGECGNGTI